MGKIKNPPRREGYVDYLLAERRKAKRMSDSLANCKVIVDISAVADSLNLTRAVLSISATLDEVCPIGKAFTLDGGFTNLASHFNFSFVICLLPLL